MPFRAKSWAAPPGLVVHRQSGGRPVVQVELGRCAQPVWMAAGGISSQPSDVSPLCPSQPLPLFNARGYRVDKGRGRGDGKECVVLRPGLPGSIKECGVVRACEHSDGFSARVSTTDPWGLSAPAVLESPLRSVFSIGSPAHYQEPGGKPDLPDLDTRGVSGRQCQPVWGGESQGQQPGDKRRGSELSGLSARAIKIRPLVGNKELVRGSEVRQTTHQCHSDRESGSLRGQLYPQCAGPAKSLAFSQ